MLFSDIRGYTAFSEANPPEVVVEMLNSYLDAQTTIIEAHGGDVDKFIGDEVVALFHGADMERNAVAAGLAIQRGLADLLEAHPEWNLHVGVGIAAGEVVMGAIGARDRLDFTALGGTVNLASRLCDAAPPDGIIVAGPVRDSLVDQDFVRFEPPAADRPQGLRDPGGRLRGAREQHEPRGRLSRAKDPNACATPPPSSTRSCSA